jgi:hypothetical protein
VSTTAVRRLAPLVILLLVGSWVVATRGDGRPARGDEEVFLQGAYLMRTHHVRAMEGVVEGAETEYGWTGAIAERGRRDGDIQAYFLLQLWRFAPDFKTGGARRGTWSPTRSRG